jgi:hypothetical protein
VSVVAIDWSGRRRGERRHLWLAEAHAGTLLRLEAGRTRAQVVDELVARIDDDPGIVVGFDFSFSLPVWFLDEQAHASARSLWDAATRDGETWLRECRPPLWGRPGRPRPELVAHVRLTEAHVAAVGGIRPKSTFQIGGAGSVGTGSVRGWPALARLQDAGYAIWPFDAPTTGPLAVEIWPRTFTGPVVKSNAAARATHVDEFLPDLSREHRSAAIASEDALDAAASAIAMSRHEAALRALPAVTDAVVRREGCIWSPVYDGLRTNTARSRATDASSAGVRISVSGSRCVV